VGSSLTASRVFSSGLGVREQLDGFEIVPHGYPAAIEIKDLRDRPIGIGRESKV
jgi:hypothetical protein